MKSTEERAKTIGKLVTFLRKLSTAEQGWLSWSLYKKNGGVFSYHQYMESSQKLISHTEDVAILFMTGTGAITHKDGSVSKVCPADLYLEFTVDYDMTLTPVQRGIRLQKIVEHLDKGQPLGLTEVEKAWIAWEMQKRLGSDEEWHVFAKRMPRFKRHRATFCKESHQVIFQDGWAIVTKCKFDYGERLWVHEVIEVLLESMLDDPAKRGSY